MRVRLVRALVVPLMVVGVCGYVAQRAPQDPAPEPPATQELLLPEPLGELWSAWGEDLAPQAAGFPQELAVLDRGEALYVLLSVRAAQVAQAVDRVAPDVDLADALREAGLAPQGDTVPAARVPDRPGCVVLTYADEPFGRSYFGWAQAPEEPGPDPTGPLEQVLLRTARVGLVATDAATCGGGSAYSPLAQEALRVLEPALLSPGSPATS